MTTRLEAIEAREQAATPGPWVDFPTGGPWTRPGVIGASNESELVYPRICSPEVDGRNGDMEFIAHSRADIPLLLTVARAVAKWVLARQRELALPEHLEADAELDEYESILLEIAAAQDEMQAAIAPLLEDAD